MATSGCQNPKVRKPSASLDSCITQGYAIMPRGLWSVCIFAQVGLILYASKRATPSRYSEALREDRGGRRLPEVYGNVGYPKTKLDPLLPARLINNYPFPVDMSAARIYPNDNDSDTANTRSRSDSCIRYSLRVKSGLTPRLANQLQRFRS